MGWVYLFYLYLRGSRGFINLISIYLSISIRLNLFSFRFKLWRLLAVARSLRSLGSEREPATLSYGGSHYRRPAANTPNNRQCYR